MRIVFFGSDAIAIPALEWLHWAEGYELAGVISQPDRPAGRGRHLHKNAVSAWAEKQGITLLQPEKAGAEEVTWLQAHQIELALVMAYGQILRRELLEAVPRGMWNLHGSLLPAYRGASPVETALAMGETVTGVSLMKVEQKMDAGAVAAMVQVPIRNTDTAPILRERIAQACVPLLLQHLPKLADGTVVTTPQDEAKVTYCRKLVKADAQLDFALPAAVLERRVRALQPWPGVAVDHEGQSLKIGAAMVVEGVAKQPPGTVVQAGPAGVEVATGEGILRLLALQRAGGRMLEAAEFLRGYKLAPGAHFASHPLPPLVSPKPFPRTAFF